MPVVAISRGSYSNGKKIAERLAKKLGYECVAQEILLEASHEFHVPTSKLAHALHDAPSFLERFTFGKEKYVAYDRAALLKHIQRDNVVYHGLAGHFLLRRVPHVLKVRIIADFEDRIKVEVKRLRISAEKARRALLKDDEARRKWSKHLYGIDTSDPALYDIVVHIKDLDVDDVVDLLARAVRRPCFRTTPESRRMVADLALAAEVRAQLIGEFPRANVVADRGRVHVRVFGPDPEDARKREKVESTAKRVRGVKQVKVSVVPLSDLADYAET